MVLYIETLVRSHDNRPIIYTNEEYTARNFANGNVFATASQGGHSGDDRGKNEVLKLKLTDLPFDIVAQVFGRQESNSNSNMTTSFFSYYEKTDFLETNPGPESTPDSRAPPLFPHPIPFTTTLTILGQQEQAKWSQHEADGQHRQAFFPVRRSNDPAHQ